MSKQAVLTQNFIRGQPGIEVALALQSMADKILEKTYENLESST